MNWTHLIIFNFMGFRSTFISSDFWGIEWPQWFKDKYDKIFCFHYLKRGANNKLLSCTIASKMEFKEYSFQDLDSDLQKILKEDYEKKQEDREVSFIFLHECDGITRLQVSKDKIIWSEPENWKITNGVTHDYCYSCSDPI